MLPLFSDDFIGIKILDEYFTLCDHYGFILFLTEIDIFINQGCIL